MSDKEPSANNNFSSEDDDFGLPKGSFSPLEENKPVENDAENTSGAPMPDPVDDLSEPSADQPEQNDVSSRSGWLVILLLLILVTVSGIGFYMGWFTPQDRGQQTTDLGQIPVEAQPPVVSETPSEVPEIPSETKKPTEELNLTEITSRGDSPRYFVVVGSFIDDDLAKDYSKKLNEGGFKTYLIHPYGDIDFYRLAVDAHTGVAEALTVIERIQGDFEENLWVLKY
ncbi:SPOR domain-containing protein [Lunatimonas salinarum]|uniref:SPOR domain-containing protein n=1 Tax=Lunatimonas salinarum TaxID=1774590 RepID=UPI001ADFA221|nr:hypothetical protein [Lunatimonas salinarum]